MHYIHNIRIIGIGGCRIASGVLSCIGKWVTSSERRFSPMHELNEVTFAGSKVDEVIYTIEPTKPTDLKNGIPDIYNKTTRK